MFIHIYYNLEQMYIFIVFNNLFSYLLYLIICLMI
jgi:hypothetical protein